MTKNTNKQHTWRFSRIGGTNRVSLDSAEDILALGQLDQKLWTALSCPIYGLELDSKTLELMDTDADNRIRVPEVIAAVNWITSILKKPEDLLKESNEFPLDSINDTNPEGKKLLLSAKQILVNLEKPDSKFITVDDTSDTVKIFAKTKFNGDGIITVDSTDDEELKNLITEIISCVGSVQDRSGKPGVSRELIDSFYTGCEQFSAWKSKSENNPSGILPFGASTEDALNALNAVKLKIDDYFLRCRLAEFDPGSVLVLNLLQSSIEAISNKNLTTCIDEIATYPLAKIEAKQPLNLEKGINPAWQAAVMKLKEKVIIPEFGNKDSLSETEWNQLSAKFEGYRSWMAEKNGELVEKLGLARIREYLSSNKKDKLVTLIEQDKLLEDEANSIVQVDKMVRYYRDLFTLLKNFVSFYDFYSLENKAIFQAGTLYIDQRSCDLCIKVSDMAKHSSIASLSGIYLLYCECTSKTKNEKMTIVAAMTNGDTDNLMVGRNAIFYDRKGQDWDATVVKIIENPISIRQAFWSPYKRISKLISEQIEKMASAKDKQLHTTAAANIEQTALKIDSAPKTPAPPFDIAKFAGIFAAIGLAFGAIGAALASLVSGFMGLTWWKMPLAILGVFLIISGPSMIIAWLKLRKRNLAPVLDANGWAINSRAIINIMFGNSLTAIAILPLNATRNLKDPFSGKKKRWLLYILILIVLLAITAYLLWHYGYLKAWRVIH